ncbi:MAG TPA: hypothetical protein VKF63_02135 [Terracidiphilus sp.]|nr:hypothetical protein [Terracidiphilus sp.]
MLARASPVEDPVVAFLLLRAPDAIGTTLKFFHFGALATPPENSTVSKVCNVNLKPSEWSAHFLGASPEGSR